MFKSTKTATTMFQDLDSSRRPGAGPDGYAVLKTHPFFKGIDWKNLRGKNPPKLAPEPGVCLVSCMKLFRRNLTLPNHHFIGQK